MLLFGPIIVCSIGVSKANDIKPLMRALMLPMVAATMITAAALLLPHDVVWSSGDRDVTAVLESARAATSEVDNGLQRFFGLYDNPNEVGTIAMLTVELILAYFGFASTKERMVLGVVAIIAAGLTVIADSRSDMVGFAIGIALYVSWKYRLKGVLAIVLIGMAAVFGITLIGNDVASYLWRGDVWTLTGRTDAWRFALRKIAERPFTGYGWAVGGAILNSKYFPIWWDFWAHGPRTSLHSGYLSHLVDIGIPATILWVFIILRPWVSLFRESEDRWCLKRAFFFLVLPMLIINFDESIVADCAGAGFLFMMLWAVAEQYRLMMIRERLVARRQAMRDLPPAVAALIS
jgi:O-antigen ligase